MCSPGETEGDNDAVVAVEDEEAEAGAGLLLAGPETLIFARPGDKVEDVEGEEDSEEGDIGGRVFMAWPAAGFFGEDTGDNLSTSCPALDASMAGCPDVDGATLVGSVFFVAPAEVKSASSFLWHFPASDSEDVSELSPADVP